jgi:hypothetical protein
MHCSKMTFARIHSVCAAFRRVLISVQIMHSSDPTKAVTLIFPIVVQTFPPSTSRYPFLHPHIRLHAHIAHWCLYISALILTLLIAASVPSPSPSHCPLLHPHLRPHLHIAHCCVHIPAFILTVPIVISTSSSSSAYFYFVHMTFILTHTDTLRLLRRFH